MPAHVIGVVRSRGRLEALTYDARPGGASPWLVEHVCELRPLAAASPLWPAWHALAAVECWDAVALGHVRMVVEATVPGLDPPDELPPLPSLKRPEPPRATAAHPRGYRGTKHRPPRDAQPEPIDVRPYLLAQRHVDQIVARCGGAPVVLPAFEPTFATFVFPAVRDGDAGAFAARGRALELAARPELRAALVGLVVAAGDHARALAWWDHVTAHPREQQLETARLAIASGATARVPPDVESALVFAARPIDERWRCYRLFAAGAATAYIESGIALDALMPRSLDEWPAGQHDVTELAQDTLARLGDACDADSGADHWRTAIWAMCGHHAEVLDLLRMPELAELAPEVAFEVLRFAHLPRLVARPELWRSFCANAKVAARAAADSAPEYRYKLVAEIYAAAGWLCDEESLEAHIALAHALGFALRVSKAPFTTRTLFPRVFAPLARYIGESGRLCGLPDATWLALEAAANRANDAELLSVGLVRLLRAAFELGMRALASHPKAAIDTAMTLAAVSVEAADDIVRAFHATPLAGSAIADAPLAELCAAVDPVAPSAIRRALREHLAGSGALSETALRGHRERIVAELDLARLAAIRGAVDRALAARVGLERVAGNARHAVELLEDAHENRRQLRRMLTATLAGDRDWLLRHPRTRDWLARHARIRDAWLAGFTLRAGDITLAIERDPLEALKLGTYVGTCLGRGGSFAFSAAAVVLDINKQVVYARDASGDVLARQLLAISDADELVSFWVYGKQGLAPQFRDFDRAYAAQLGVPICEGNRTIANVLSHNWFDDGDWTG